MSVGKCVQMHARVLFTAMNTNFTIGPGEEFNAVPGRIVIERIKQSIKREFGRGSTTPRQRLKEGKKRMSRSFLGLYDNTWANLMKREIERRWKTIKDDEDSSSFGINRSRIRG